MIAALSARLFAALAMTGLASQSAEFSQQYLQRLGGAADELTASVSRFDNGALAQGLDRNSAIERLRGNGDPFVSSQGQEIGTTVVRAEETQGRYERLLDTAPIMRPFVVMSDPDWSIASRALDDYRPALPVTMDGVLLTMVGFLLGWAGGASGHGAVRIAKRKRKARSEAMSGAGDGGPNDEASPQIQAAPRSMRDAALEIDRRTDDGPARISS